MPTVVRPLIRAARRIALIAIVALSFAAPSADAQLLDQMRQDVRVGEPPAAPNNTKPQNNSSSDNGDIEVDGDVASGILCVVAAPFWLPVKMLGDEDLARGYFLRYPYWDDLPGSMWPSDRDGPKHRPWAGEIAFEYANNLDDLSRYGGHLRISTASRFDVETNWNWFDENTPTGHDHLSLGDVDLLFRFAQSETLQFRSGLGANWLSDRAGVNAGFNFRYGVEWFPVRPWAFKSLIDLGELGKADLIHVRSTVGLNYQRWELFTGYDYRKIGDVHIDGPVAGLELRF